MDGFMELMKKSDVINQMEDDLVTLLWERDFSHITFTTIDEFLEKGSIFGFIGPNGAGKTTTMRILATLLNPTWGEAYVCGHSIYNGSKEIRRVADIVRARLHMKPAVVVSAMAGITNRLFKMGELALAQGEWEAEHGAVAAKHRETLEALGLPADLLDGELRELHDLARVVLEGYDPRLERPVALLAVAAGAEGVLAVVAGAARFTLLHVSHGERAT